MDDSPPPAARVFPSPVMIAAIYAALGFAYILFSDSMVAALVNDPGTLTTVQTIKGWGFVLVSSLVIYWLTHRSVCSVQAAVSEQRLADARYRRLIETAHEGVWVVRHDGTTEYVNSSMARMLGYEPHEMQDQHRSRFMDEHWRRIAEEKAGQRHAGNADRYEFEFRRKDGAPLWAIVSSSPIVDEQGQVTGVLKMVTDISERKKVEDALAHSLELERMLFNELDHRVRNNLMAVLSLVVLTRESETDVRQFAATIGSRVQALAHAQGMLPEAMRGNLVLGRLIERLVPADAKSQVTIQGPDVSVGVAQTGAVSLLVGELISLSRACGSLSRPDGTITISWVIASQSIDCTTVQLQWQESRGIDAVCARMNETCRPILDGLLRSDLRGGFMSVSGLSIEMKLDRPTVPDVATAAVKPART